MHLFVAGATGYTGRNLVRIAAERQGMRVHAHVRPDSPQLPQWRDRFGMRGVKVDTTAWDEAKLTERLNEIAPDAVFALLGTTRKRAKAAKERGVEADYEAVDYGLTAMLLRACQAIGNDPRFVYLSSMGVREGTKNPYLAVRARMEAEVRASGLPWVIARPSFISGSDRDEHRPGERIASTLGDGLLGAAGALGMTKLRDRYQSLTGDELARALLRLAIRPNHADEVVEADGLRELAASSA
ncbi:MAG: epimerase [Sandaracinus sp.]|nr:epimerase [Sandaracinus sp.]|tara:strand:+ start:1684 stop:2409 length:726 start_codon:yes stop_codon:yes gene_type:complete